MSSYTLHPVGFIRSNVKGRQDAPRQGPEFAYRRGVANIYVIDRRGRIVNQTTGPVSIGALLLIARAIDNAILDS